jgi:hypothetical protein
VIFNQSERAWVCVYVDLFVCECIEPFVVGHNYGLVSCGAIRLLFQIGTSCCRVAAVTSIF